MCGIAAIMGRLSTARVASALESMLSAQVHRGPDDQGSLVLQLPGGSLGLGNRRLAIQDLTPYGHQPMKNPDTGDILVYNGEIYNAPELRQLLQSVGFYFRGHSDTEVLLRAYERWGTDCLQRLRGMFAFALWDARHSRLLLVRDHLGIKPLYYSNQSGRLICASEVRAIVESGLIDPQIDRRALGGYLAYGGVQEPFTIFEGVEPLPPGCWRQFNSSGDLIAQGDHWTPPPLDNPAKSRPLADIVEEGRALLEQSVRRHLLSDVRIGIFLSSGLDSTAILGMSQELSHDPESLEAFTVSFPGSPAHDENGMARATAARLGVHHHECPIESSTAQLWIRDALDSMDQPSMDGFNTYIVARAVAEHGISVALSGLGADEIFGGYDLFRFASKIYRVMGWLAPLPLAVRVAAARLATVRRAEVAKLKAREIAETSPGLIGTYFHLRRLVSDQALAKLGLTAKALSLSEDLQDPGLRYQGCFLPPDATASVGRLDLSFYLKNILLRDSDVFGMANSLEIRVPFLDRDLVDWALRLPSDVLLPKGSAPKHLLRRISAPYYSPPQLQQPKQGFSLPLAEWLLDPLRDLMEDGLWEARNSGLFNSSGIDQLRTSFDRAPDSPAWSRVWALVTLGYWLKRHTAPVMAAAHAG